MWIFILILILLIVGLTVFSVNRQQVVAKQKQSITEKNATLEKYTPIRDVEETLKEIQEIVGQKEQDRDNIEITIQSLQSKEFSLKKSIQLLEEQDFLHSCGFYESHYNFENLVIFERELKDIRNKQKKMLQDKTAVEAPSSLTVGGSKPKGQAYIKKLTKLTLQSFNGECDAAVLKVNYKNIVTLETRIEKVFEKINNIIDEYSFALSKTSNFLNFV